MNKKYPSGLVQVIVLASVGGSLWSCGSGPKSAEKSESPVIKMGDRGESAASRADAARELWASVQGNDDQMIDNVREELKKIVWKQGAPREVREAALECLFADVRVAGVADTANLLRLCLPTEPDFEILKYVCGNVASRATDEVWKKTVTGLVRSWARPLEEPTDDARPERSTIAALYPGKAVEDVVFDVFVDPVVYGARPDDEQAKGMPWPDSAKRVRSAAWEVLGRIDPSGARRRMLLAHEATSRDNEDPMLRTLHEAARELGVVPLTGSELEWVAGMRTSKSEMDRKWWESVKGVVAGLSGECREGLMMRHLEPIRWANEHQPRWLTMSRVELATLLAQRLENRRTYRVGQNEGVDFSADRNRLEDWQDQLVWGDLISILVIDEAIADPGVRTQVFVQALGDRADTSTEWGGCLIAGEMCGSDARAAFHAMVFPARPAQRINDRTFVASDAMFEAGENREGCESGGGRSLAHYHYHAQSVTNDAYAGPGKGDREYVQRHNRNCVVFTSLREGVLNADWYCRSTSKGGGGKSAVVNIDLGEVRENVR